MADRRTAVAPSTSAAARASGCRTARLRRRAPAVRTTCCRPPPRSGRRVGRRPGALGQADVRGCRTGCRGGAVRAQPRLRWSARCWTPSAGTSPGWPGPRRDTIWEGPPTEAALTARAAADEFPDGRPWPAPPPARVEPSWAATVAPSGVGRPSSRTGRWSLGVAELRPSGPRPALAAAREHRTGWWAGAAPRLRPPSPARRGLTPGAACQGGRVFDRRPVQRAGGQPVRCGPAAALAAEQGTTPTAAG